MFAAGNENNNNDTNPQYPCGYAPANIVCVAASNADDNRASFSNYGASAVDLAAPGTTILSTYPFPVPFEDDFQVANFSSRWTTGGTRNTWGRLCSGGECSMADSPGNYQNNTNSWSRTASAFNLSGMSDCRAQYFLWLDTEPNVRRHLRGGLDQRHDVDADRGVVRHERRVDLAGRGPVGL